MTYEAIPLFGDLPDPVEGPVVLPLTDEEKRQAAKDRAKERRATNPLLALYGKGPEGVTCKTCVFLLRDRHHDQTYLKCLKNGVTRGAGSDWKAGYQSCGKYEEEEETAKGK